MEEIESKAAQDLINQAIEEIKQKEEKNISKKPSKVPSKAIIDEDTKQNTVTNKNTKRLDSMSSSDSDSSPQDISDDEKNEEIKNYRNKKEIKNKFKSSMASDSSLENLMVSEDFVIKIATLVSAVICIVTISLNIISSLINNKLTLTFGYSKNKDALSNIVMNHTMIYILLAMMIILNFGLFIAILLGNDHMLTKLIYTDLNWYFVFTQLALGFQFLITLIWDIDLWTINVCLSVSMLAILILAFYFTEIKQKKNMSKCTFFFIYIYVSLLFSFIAYITLFNISCILMENFDDKSENSDSMTTLTIIIKVGINAAQTILSLVLLTYYKDIFFSFTSAYIESAVFIHLDTKFENENIALLVMVCLIVFGIFITLIGYKKKTFGCEEVPVEITKDFN
jgi:hypothetical protein